MKENKIFFVIMIILALIVSISTSCSEKKKELSKEELLIQEQKEKEYEKKVLKSKIGLLCMKYDVDSKDLREDLFDYFYPNFSKSYESRMKDLETEETKVLLYGKEIDKGKLISISQKHNIPISKISGIVYDRMTMQKIEDIEERLPSE